MEQSSRGENEQLSHIPKSIKKACLNLQKGLFQVNHLQRLRRHLDKEEVHAAVLKCGSTGRLSSIQYRRPEEG